MKRSRYFVLSFVGVFLAVSSVFVLNFRLKPTGELDGYHSLDIAITKLDDMNGVRFLKSKNVVFGGAWELNSDSLHFGGISGFRYFDGGKKILAVTDAGALIVSDVVSLGLHDFKIDNSIITSLFGKDDFSLRKLGKGDAEAVEITKDGHLYVSHEGGGGGVVQYVLKGMVFDWVSYIDMPFDVRMLPKERGVEAIAIVPGSNKIFSGYLLAIAERNVNGGIGIPGWVVGNGSYKSFFYNSDSGYDVTDMSFVGERHLLVLERKIDFFCILCSRIRMFEFDESLPGFLKGGEVLMEGGWFSGLDNMEALSVFDIDGCKYGISIISDNNFSFFQKTVLFNFLWSLDSC